jgi:hypothetical protein
VKTARARRGAEVGLDTADAVAVYRRLGRCAAAVTLTDAGSRHLLEQAATLGGRARA